MIKESYERFLIEQAHDISDGAKRAIDERMKEEA
jgi:hypothetical protein